MKEFDEEVDVYAVNHLPIVKAYADKIGLVEIVNQLVPSEMEVEPGIIFWGWFWTPYQGEVLFIV